MAPVLVPPHRIYSDFLPQESVAGLLAYTLSFRERFTPSRVGQGRIALARRRSVSTPKLGPLGDELRARVAALAPELTAELAVSPFVLSKVELQLVAHGDGAFQKPHLDTGLTGHDLGSRSRRLTAVYYFHRLPRAFSGGALRLYPFFAENEDTGCVDIEPVCNRLVAFPAWARHEVRPVALASGRFEDSRFAVNCWLHEEA